MYDQLASMIANQMFLKQSPASHAFTIPLPARHMFTQKFIDTFPLKIKTAFEMAEEDYKKNFNGITGLKLPNSDDKALQDILLKYYSAIEAFFSYVILIESENEDIENDLLERDDDNQWFIPTPTSLKQWKQHGQRLKQLKQLNQLEQLLKQQKLKQFKQEKKGFAMIIKDLRLLIPYIYIKVSQILSALGKNEDTVNSCLDSAWEIACELNRESQQSQSHQPHPLYLMALIKTTEKKYDLADRLFRNLPELENELSFPAAHFKFITVLKSDILNQMAYAAAQWDQMQRASQSPQQAEKIVNKRSSSIESPSTDSSSQSHGDHPQDYRNTENSIPEIKMTQRDIYTIARKNLDKPAMRKALGEMLFSHVLKGVFKDPLIMVFMKSDKRLFKLSSLNKEKVAVSVQYGKLREELKKKINFKDQEDDTSTLEKDEYLVRLLMTLKDKNIMALLSLRLEEKQLQMQIDDIVQDQDIIKEYLKPKAQEVVTTNNEIDFTPAVREQTSKWIIHKRAIDLFTQRRFEEAKKHFRSLDLDPVLRRKSLEYLLSIAFFMANDEKEIAHLIDEQHREDNKNSMNKSESEADTNRRSVELWHGKILCMLKRGEYKKVADIYNVGELPRILKDLISSNKFLDLALSLKILLADAFEKLAALPENLGADAFRQTAKQIRSEIANKAGEVIVATIDANSIPIAQILLCCLGGHFDQAEVFLQASSRELKSRETIFVGFFAKMPSAESTTFLALFYEAIGNRKQAIELYKDAQEIASSDGEAWDFCNKRLQKLNSSQFPPELNSRFSTFHHRPALHEGAETPTHTLGRGSNEGDTPSSKITHL